MNVGTKVKFRNGEFCTIQRIITSQLPENNKQFEARIRTNKITKPVQATTFVLEFDDGEITIANQNEFKVI